MSPRSSSSGPSSPGVYDGLMLVAAASMIAGIIFLVIELGRYDWTLAG